MPRIKGVCNQSGRWRDSAWGQEKKVPAVNGIVCPNYKVARFFSTKCESALHYGAAPSRCKTSSSAKKAA